MNNVIQEVQNKYSFLDNLLTNFWKSWIKSNLTFKLQLKNIKWKNARAKPGFAYQPTEIEQLANVITHGIWIVPALMCANKLYERSKSSGQYLVSLVYGTSLTLLFTVSSVFHCSCYCTNHVVIKNALHRCDRAMIYIFIAASYFPWLLLDNHEHSFVLTSMEWIVWVMAASGIVYQQIFHERFKCLETGFYILMGLGPAVVIFCTGHEFRGMTEIKLGGFFYILGIWFFKSDGIIPMAHAIWHLFVIVASGFHYYAILVNLYPVFDSNTNHDNL